MSNVHSPLRFLGAWPGGWVPMTILVVFYDSNYHSNHIPLDFILFCQEYEVRLPEGHVASGRYAYYYGPQMEEQENFLSFSCIIAPETRPSLGTNPLHSGLTNRKLGLLGHSLFGVQKMIIFQSQLQYGRWWYSSQTVMVIGHNSYILRVRYMYVYKCTWNSELYVRRSEGMHNIVRYVYRNYVYCNTDLYHTADTL